MQQKLSFKNGNITEEENTEFHSKTITRACDTQMDAYFNTWQTSANRSTVKEIYSTVPSLVI